MATVGSFLWGFIAEFLRLMLVMATGMLAATLFGTRMGPASPALMAEQMVFFGLYSLLVLVPARDVVQGWLGMLAGRQPSSYDEVGENLGRGLSDLALTGLFVWILIGTFGVMDPATEDASSNAFGFAFMAFTLLVFGVGSAVPRFWFVVRTAPGSGDERLPELLSQAAKRAAVVCYCAFFSVGLALAAARVTAAVRHLPPAPRHLGVPPHVPPPPPLLEDASGSACYEGPRCTAEAWVSVTAPHTGPLSIQVLDDGEPPLCPIATVGDWASKAQLDRLAERVNAPRGEGETAVAGPPLLVQVKAKARVSLWMPLQEGDPRCSYHIIIRQPPAPGARPL